MCEQCQPSPARAPRHHGGMMAETTGKSAPQHPVRAIVDNKSRRSLYNRHHGAPPLGAMAHLRSSSSYRGFSSGRGWKREASKPSGFPEGGAGGLAAGVCCLKLWIGRKRNVGGGVLADFSLAGASLCGNGRRETSAVLRFDSSSLIDRGSRKRVKIDVLGTRQTL
jgi:hypothetical protein